MNTPSFKITKYTVVYIVLLMLLISSNSLYAQSNKRKRKKVQKSGWVSNQYQDLTARYNRYFNAKLKYEEGLEILRSQNKDDYESQLSVYEFNGEDGAAISSNLDEVIKKTSLNVQLKPNSKWIDDSFLLLGQAYYLKGEYDEAVKSFQYVINRYGNSLRKSYDRRSREKVKQLRDKERAKDKKAREQQLKEEKKQREQERELALKEREKAKKERNKERAKVKKEREKTRKATAKERDKKLKEKRKNAQQVKKEKAKKRDKIRKLKAKEKKYRNKIRDKNRKLRKKGKKTIVYKPKYYWPEKFADKEEENEEQDLEETPPVVVEEAPEPKDEEVKTEEEPNEEKAAKDEEKIEEDDESDLSTAFLGDMNNGKEKAYKSGGAFSFLKHKPASYPAKLWLARTYIDMEDFGRAGSILSNIAEDKNFPKRLADEYNTLNAHYQLTQGNVEMALPALELAAKKTKPKKDGARLWYILAQLYEDAGNYAEAINAYKKTIKAKPSFEMEFNSELKLVLARLAAQQISPERAIAQLEKMTKEEKNKVYQDQLFFALSEIALSSGNEELAAAYLNESATQSVDNPVQKANAYLKLADINYDKENYLLASTFYDSTMLFIPATNERYNEISNRQTILAELAQYEKTVLLKDSLARIASMPKNAREDFIDDYIAKLKKAALDRQEQQFLEENNMPNANTAGTTGDWYFYNPASVSRGYTEFKQKWGSRPLADNWRLSSRLADTNLASIPEINEVPSTDDLIDLATQGLLSREQIIESLPLTAQQKEAADSTILYALYQAAKIYAYQIDNPSKSIKTLEKLQARFPKSKYEPEVMYQLVLLNKQLSNTNEAVAWQKQLIDAYPDSYFSLLVKNPELATTGIGPKSEVEDFYQETYALYNNQEYNKVINRKQIANERFAPNYYAPQFDLLEALAIGHTRNKQDYIVALQNVTTKHQDTEVGEKAAEMLSYLTTNISSSSSNSATNTSSVFQVGMGKPHYFVLALNEYSQKLVELANNFSDFNQSNFSVNQLRVNQMLLDPQHQIILVKTFDNGQDALNYYRAIQQNEMNVYQDIDVGYNYFVISKANFTHYFKQKDPAQYIEFFNSNYLD